MQEQPIYDAVVREHKFDPSRLTRFNFDAFLAAHRKPRRVSEKPKPRKAARRAPRS